MNKPINDQTLERLLLDYGQIPPPAPFQYRPRPAMPAKFTKRLAAWSVAALLSLLILGLTATVIAQFSADIPFVNYDPSSTTAAIVQNTTIASPTSPPPGTEPQPPVTPEVTDPPVPPVTNPPDPPKPPVTNPPDPPKPPVTNPNLPSLLPSWYKSPSVRLVNCIPSASQSSFQPVTLKEIYNDYAALDLDMGNYRYSFVSGDLILMHDRPASHQESFCKVVYLRPSDGELICLGHELKELWASAGVSYSGNQTLYNLNASKDGNRYVVAIETQPGEGAVLVYDRKAQTLKKVPFTQAQFDAMDFVSFSDDCNYMVAALVREEDDLLDDLVLVDLNAMEITPICAGYNTFGHSKFSFDGRFVYTHLRIEDAVEQNEYGQWVLYDTQTGFTFKGEGQVLYLQDGILISRTPEGFTAYDCTTGERPEDLSSLPLIIDADYQYKRYTITVYNPATDSVEAIISNVGSYELCGNYLYYYIHRAEGVVIADLISGESITLPVSATLLAGANPSKGYTHYSLAVSSDGSTISLGYTISIEDYPDQFEQDADALRELIANAALNTNNIPDFLDCFHAHSAPYEYLIRYTDYDIHEGYVILQISTVFREDIFTPTWEFHLVEDYRDGSFTLYNASDNPYLVSGIHARSAYETKVQTFRRPLKNGNYDTSCARLTAIGKHRPFYIDYALCYDETGKWSAELVKQYVLSYEFLSLHTADANAKYTPEALERTLQIITRYIDNPLNLQKLTARRVMDIRLFSHDQVELYLGRVYISTDGKYYLQNDYGELSNRCVEITYEEYLTLMEAQGGFLVKSGMYKDIRIASVMKPLADQAEYDFLVTGALPDTNLLPHKVHTVLAMIREGGHSSEEMMNVLFEHDEEWEYIRLLCEYIDEDRWLISNRRNIFIRIIYANGEFSFSDPNPEIPLPASAQ